MCKCLHACRSIIALALVGCLIAATPAPDVNDEQKHIAEAYIAQLEQARSFRGPIVTQVVPMTKFYDAELYHQNYARFHPEDSYIARNDAPKVERLREQFPDLYKK